MALFSTQTLDDESRRRLTIGFNNFAHAVDHYVMLIFPTVVIGLEVVYGRPYGELLALGTASFFAFGIFSLPAGWLADRWSRRYMMVVFYIGCGAELRRGRRSRRISSRSPSRCSRSACSPRSIIRSAPRSWSRPRPIAAARSPSTASAAISASRSPPASPRR